MRVPRVCQCVCVPVQLELWLNLGSVAFTSCDVRMNATHQSERKLGRVRLWQLVLAKTSRRQGQKRKVPIHCLHMTGRYGCGSDGTGVCLA